jgi:peptide/nickel transport system permease protein
MADMKASVTRRTPAPADRIRALRTRSGYLDGLLSARGLTGLVLVGLIVAAGVCAPLLTGISPTAQSSQGLAAAGADHLFGTDNIGRDVFSRVLYGIRTDLLIILTGVPIGAAGGCALALLATANRVADVIVQRALDLVLAFPGLVLAIAVTAILGPGERPVILVVAIAEVPGFARILRSGILVEREREYAVAARVGGAGRLRVMLRHVLPNAADPLIVQLAVSLSIAVFVEGGMSFLGLGVTPPDPSLGSVLSESMPYLSTQPAFAVGPLIAVTVLVVGFTLLAEALNKGVRR